MNKYLFLIFSLSSTAQTVNPAYDSLLSRSLGADNYGMKMYVFVILKTGSIQIENKSIRDSLFS